MNDLTIANKKEIQEVTNEKITEYINTFLPNQLSQHEVKQFVEIAKAYNLNPFKREIYCIAYGQGQGRKLSLLTGYEVYIKKAERTGLLTGWKAWTIGEIKDKSLKGCIEIYKKGWEKPFYHEVDFVEYNQNNKIWNEKPKTMIKKVAIAQGFRLAFADDLGGVPYTADEMPEGNEIREVNPVNQNNVNEEKREQVPTAQAPVNNQASPEALLYVEIEKFKDLYLDKILLDGEDLAKMEKTKSLIDTTPIDKMIRYFTWLCKENIEFENLIKIARENVKPEIDIEVEPDNLTFGQEEVA